jgi:hypothetical protein
MRFKLIPGIRDFVRVAAAVALTTALSVYAQDTAP